MGKLIECLRGREKFVILFAGASGWLNISSLVSPSRLSYRAAGGKKDSQQLAISVRSFEDLPAYQTLFGRHQDEVRALGSHEWVDKAINHLVSDGFVRITPGGGD